jgi:hypothetical protein
MAHVILEDLWILNRHRGASLEINPIDLHPWSLRAAVHGQRILVIKHKRPEDQKGLLDATAVEG